MATVHDLPQELIKHILSLAYLKEYQPHSSWPSPLLRFNYRPAKAGLAAAALVHRGWTRPAQGLLWLHLRFHGSTDCDASLHLQRLMEALPEEFDCRRIEFEGLEGGALVELLRRVRAGRVRELKLGTENVPEGLFRLAALSALESVVWTATADLAPNLSWPTTLATLEVFTHRTTLPVKLLTHSAATLTTLTLHVRWPTSLYALAVAAPSLTSLTSLSITYIAKNRPADTLLFDALADAVNALHALATLSLTAFGPPPLRLAALLTELRPAPSLRTLRTSVPGPAVHYAAPMELLEVATARWLAEVRECAEAEWVGQLDRWEVGVRPEGGQRLEALEVRLARAPGGWEEWGATVGALRERGVSFEGFLDCRHGRWQEEWA